MRKVFIILFLLYLGANAYFLFSNADTLSTFQEGSFIDDLSRWSGLMPDKIMHILLFIPIVPMAWLAIKPQWAFTKVVILWSGLLLGVLTEYVQHFMPSRTCDINDVLADVTGSVLGMPFLLLALLFYKKR